MLHPAVGLISNSAVIGAQILLCVWCGLSLFCFQKKAGVLGYFWFPSWEPRLLQVCAVSTEGYCWSLKPHKFTFMVCFSRWALIHFYWEVCHGSFLSQLFLFVLLYWRPVSKMMLLQPPSDWPVWDTYEILKYNFSKNKVSVHICPLQSDK